MQLEEVKKLVDTDHKQATKFLHIFEYEYQNNDGVLIHVYNLLGDCYIRADNIFESERYYRKALEINPKNIAALAGIEPVLRDQEKLNEVYEVINTLLKEIPSISKQLTTSLGMANLMEGNLKEGFQRYENRYSYSDLEEAYKKPIFPRWNGKEDLAGKKVLFRYEQGLGDTIQFVRYIKKLKEFGPSKIDVLSKVMLHRLIKTIDEVDGVINEIKPEMISEKHYDYEVMMMSMPALLNIQNELDIPSAPYLKVKPEDSLKWKEKLSKFTKLKVGIVWSGELKKWNWFAERSGIRKSLSLDQFRPILDVDCDFFSLQKGERQNDLKDFYAAHHVNDLMNEVLDFYDTACFIDNLDLVITVDTSIAHVTGAMGKPVWMILNYGGCWRWMIDRQDSPWYPSMKIFRQTQYGNWQPIISQLSSELKQYCKKDK